jgi:FkbM family methyltransferase
MGIAKHVRRVSPRLWFYFKSLRYKFYNGEDEIWSVRHLLTRGKLAVDIGASIGLYSRELAKYATKVVAFEANPRVAAFARRVASHNVEVLNVAISSADGETELRTPFNRRNHAIDDLATIEPKNPLHFDRVIAEKVATRRLDGYAFVDCGFIKIDVEGHEEAVLDGAMHLIESQRPVMMIELDDRFNPGIVERVTKRLSDPGYTAYFLLGNRLLPTSDFAPRNLSDIKSNFIFVPNEAKARILSHFRAA